MSGCHPAEPSLLVFAQRFANTLVIFQERSQSEISEKPPESDFYISTFFAIELPSQRIKIGVSHIDLYSSCERPYNKRVTDEVPPL